MLSPLQQWFCDTCGGVIEKPEDGYVIWRQDKDNLDFDFKIIHQSRCDNSRYSSSAALGDFLGTEGLNILLSLLSYGQIKSNNGSLGGNSIKDMDEFVDFFRRLQTPYYEEARRHFWNGDLLADFSDANEMYPYQVEVLQRIISEYSTEQ